MLDAGTCVDGRVAFLGGLDLCDARRDNRRHEQHNADRIDVHGQPYKPFHDIQVAVRGPVVGCLEQLFVESWRRARGEASELPSSAAPVLSRSNAAASGPDPEAGVDPFGLERLTQGGGEPVSGRVVALSRTECDDSGQGERSKLQLVLVMPDGADSPKEDFVLGNRQRVTRRFIADVAEHYGHSFRLLMSSVATDSERAPATFIHSKLMIVDDEFSSIGSANFTNRSMRVDREVNVTWQAGLEAPAAAEQLSHDIRRLRAALPSLPKSDADNPLLIAIFDPSGPLDWATIDQSLEEAFDFDEGFLKKTAKKSGPTAGCRGRRLKMAPCRLRSHVRASCNRPSGSFRAGLRRPALL